MFCQASLLIMLLLAADPGDQTITGRVRFEPADGEARIAPQFRLAAHTFEYCQTPVPTAAESIEIFEVTFPSPVKTAHVNNNTVHCEYFRPRAGGRKTPGVIALHILGGDFPLTRLFCRTLAHNGVAALFVKLPYYGPRRHADAPARMISLDPRETAAGMRQAVLDIRRARAWLAHQDELDPQQLGIFGISLGGITSALAVTAEPRFSKVCLMLAGGDIASVGWETPHYERARKHWLALGGTKETFLDLLRAVDPVTYAENVRGRDVKMLMLNARHDEIIPYECTDALWRAFGQPEIVWWDAGHISAGRFIFDGLARVTEFFQDKSDSR
jgi:cephalosporin-C deacetylase-like acetyl esterase